MNHLLFTQKNVATLGNPNVTMLLAGESSPALTNGISNKIYDISSNALSTSIGAGSPSVGTFSPYGTNWSMDFNGSSSLSFPASTNFGFGTGAFTIECWINMTQFNSNNCQIVDFRATVSASALAIGIDSTGHPYYYDGPNNSQVSASTAISLNTWYHIALSRDASGVWRLFLNGSQIYTSTSADNLGSSQPALIGTAVNGLTYAFSGFISNFKVVKGSALYTSNFTPATSPLTVTSGTVLLLSGYNFNDLTGNNVPTMTGTIEITRFSPFSTGNPTAYSPSSTGTSVYMNGSSYLSASATTAQSPNASPFTVECFMYLNSLPASGSANSYYVTQRGSVAATNNFEYGLYILNNSGSYEIQLELSTSGTSATSYNSNPVTLFANCWYHLAVTKSGTTLTFWLNGQSVGTQTVPSSLYVGNGSFFVGSNAAGNGPMFPGYIADVRHVVGSALYTTTFTPPTKPLTAITGTVFMIGSTQTANNYCEIYDAAGDNNYFNSGVTISSSQSKFNGTSLNFNGTSYLSNNSMTYHPFGTGNFTVELWAMTTSTIGNYFLLDARTGTPADWMMNFNNSTTLSWQINGTNHNATVSISLNTWFHVAVVRNGTTMNMYLNGTSVATWTDSTNYATNNPLVIGSNALGGSGSSTYSWHGYMSDIRITNAAVYTANFTPPTSSFVGK